MLLAKVNLTAALPPPVTHRLDLLVAGAREAKASRVLRRDIVAALVTLHAPETAAEGYDLYREYLECKRPPTDALAICIPRRLDRTLSVTQRSPGLR
ncbi:MAG: hypothetical protein WKF96_10750 [Solirubrobacteraceae bacterium]